MCFRPQDTLGPEMHWVTGGILLSDNQLGDFDGSTNVATVNGTVANDTIARCLKGTERHLAWGVMTIAMSWIPSTFAVFFMIYAADGLKHQIATPLRFILWPLLVPVYMYVILAQKLSAHSGLGISVVA